LQIDVDIPVHYTRVKKGEGETKSVVTPSQKVESIAIRVGKVDSTDTALHTDSVFGGPVVFYYDEAEELARLKLKAQEKEESNRSAAEAEAALKAQAAGRAGVSGIPRFDVYRGDDAVSRFEAKYDFMSVLGRGGFGGVVRVRLKSDPSKQFALKIIQKSDVNKGNSYRDEVDLLRMINHPFIIHLYDAFENDERIFLLLELLRGGTGQDIVEERKVGAMLKFRRKPILESVSLFYASESVLAIEYLHSMNIAHRDLKPDNILFDEHGHIRIADLGIARKIDPNDPESIQEDIGLSGFKAPEVIKGGKYGMAVDWWNMGVMTYTFLAAKHPFDRFLTSKDSVVKKYTLEDVEPIPNVSYNANDFCLKLLDPEPSKRLGFHGSEEVKQHPFFRDVDWEATLKKQINPKLIRTTPVKEHVHIDVKETPEFNSMAEVVQRLHDMDPTKVTLPM